MGSHSARSHEQTRSHRIQNEREGIKYLVACLLYLQAQIPDALSKARNADYFYVTNRSPVDPDRRPAREQSGIQQIEIIANGKLQTPQWVDR